MLSRLAEDMAYTLDITNDEHCRDEYAIKKAKIKGEETLVVKFAPGEELRIVNKIDPDLTN